MNYMEQVAKMLGVELEEPFKIIYSNNAESIEYYRFTKNGFEFYYDEDNEWLPGAQGFIRLILGQYKIKKKPFLSKDGERFYFIDVNKNVQSRINDQKEFDIMSYILGNCFKTEEEAEDNKEETWERCYGKYFEEIEDDNK